MVKQQLKIINQYYSKTTPLLAEIFKKFKTSLHYTNWFTEAKLQM